MLVEVNDGALDTQLQHVMERIVSNQEVGNGEFDKQERWIWSSKTFYNKKNRDSFDSM